MQLKTMHWILGQGRLFRMGLGEETKSATGNHDQLLIKFFRNS